MRQVLAIAAVSGTGALLVLSALQLGSVLDGGSADPDPGTPPGESAAFRLAQAASDEPAQERGAWPWLPAFGTPAPPETPVRQTVSAAPRFDYRLAGVMASGGMKWAILTGPGGEVLVREGDTLDGTARIDDIHSQGITVSLKGEARALVFDGAGAMRVATIEAPAPPAPAVAEPARGNLDARLAERQAALASRPRVQEVIFKDMSREELLAVLNRAEEGRRLRKLGATETR